MTLNLQAIAFLLGAGLIIVAIVGGGVEIRDLRIPSMAAVPRTLAAVFGGLLMIGATPVGPALLGVVWAVSTTNSVQTNTQNAVPIVAGQGNVAAPAPAPAQAPVETKVPAIPANVVEPAAAATDRDAALTHSVAPSQDPDEGSREITLTDTLGDDQKYEKVRVTVNGKLVGLISVDREQPSDSLSFRVRGGDTYELSGSEAVLVEGKPVGRLIRGSGTFSEEERLRYLFARVSHDRNSVTLQLVGK